MNMENSKTGKNSSNYRIMMFASTNECIYSSLPFHSLHIFFLCKKNCSITKKKKAKEDAKREPATKESTGIRLITHLFVSI